MAPFTLDQWIMTILAFLLGLFIGGALFASTRWKRRYRDEFRRREEADLENERLRKEALHTDTLHRAALKHPVDRDTRGPI